MGRIPRMKISDEPTVYHIISRTALDGLPIGDAEKDYLVALIKKLSKVYFAEILGYCIMGSHFHLLVKMHPQSSVSSKDVTERFEFYYGTTKKLLPEKIQKYKNKWSDLSEFVKEIKQTFARHYNKNHNRVGFFWGDRFKSLIVEKGETLINCLAYIDLNPVRAGIVKVPEAYRWSTIGRIIQTGNKDGFISLDLGVSAFAKVGKARRIQLYRKFIYETGAVKRRGKGAIDQKQVKKEAENDFDITRSMRFKYRTRYFTDAGIIGTKKYVFKVYSQFKHYFQSKNDRNPNSVKGLKRVFSLKRLREKDQLLTDSA